MPKARSFTPNSSESKRWYTHLPQCDADKCSPESAKSRRSTSTRDQQEAPFEARNVSKVAANMPRVFYTRINHQPPIFKYQNAFTAHDNRNAFQGHGVYFGESRADRSLGKRLLPSRTVTSGLPEENADAGGAILRHEDGSRYGYDYRTNYTTAYAPICCPTPPALFRRFRRCHTHPEICIAELPTCTAEYAPLPPGSISTETLGQSQIPYEGHNSWKYSYNRIQRAYPDLPALRIAGQH